MPEQIRHIRPLSGRENAAGFQPAAVRDICFHLLFQTTVGWVLELLQGAPETLFREPLI